MSARAFREEAMKSRFKNESQFEAWVIRILKTNGWLVTSMHDSRRQQWGTDAGIPDIIAVHAEKKRLLFAELKMPGNKPSPGQKKWLDALLEVVFDSSNPEAYHHFFVKKWYPKDEYEIIELAGGKLPLG